MSCIGEPISYLRLERYGLGELSPVERQRIREHLAACAVCRGCFERVQADTRASDLAWLTSRLELAPPVAGAKAVMMPAPSRGWAGWRSWIAWGGGALGAGLALGLALMILPSRPTRPRAGSHAARDSAAPAPAPAPPKGARSKGDPLALELIRRDAQGRLLDPIGFAVGDRFKLLLTCPPELTGTVRVLAFQAGEVFEPIPAQQLRCGNRRALTGALQLDGDAPVALCAVFADNVGPDRISQARSPETLPAARVCVRLAPSPRAADPR